MVLGPCDRFFYIMKQDSEHFYLRQAGSLYTTKLRFETALVASPKKFFWSLRFLYK